MKACLAAFLAMSAMATLVLPARADDLPAELRGPVAGMAEQCRSAGQAEPALDAILTRADFDGDGLPDYVLNQGASCQAARDLYCGDEGCSIDVYVSSAGYLAAGSFKTRSLAVEDRGGDTVLVLQAAGPACGRTAAETCEQTYQWVGDAFAAGP